MSSEAELIAHASSVVVEGSGLLILGPSGAGKSRLALEMIALGATLVSDDRVVLSRDGGTVTASPPKPLEGLVEARGIGLLECPFARSAPIRMVVDLGAPEPDRLPPERSRELLGVALPLILGRDAKGLAAALFVLMKSGGARRAP